MEEIHCEFEDTHDENALLTGFIEFKSLKLYDVGEKVPSDKDIIPKSPCLVIEVLDTEESTAEVKLMRPAHWIPINKKQTNFFKRYLALKAIEDERQKMV